MLTKILQKVIMLSILGAAIVACAPKYTANFQSKPHKMSRYTIQDLDKDKQDIAIVDKETEVILEEFHVKQVVTEPNQIEELTNDENKEVIRPQSREELIEVLRENPDGIVALQMTKKERRELKKEAKEKFKESENAAAAVQGGEPNKWPYYILSIIPPLGVGLWRGIGSEFWISLLLTLLIWLPGLIYAIIVISNKPKTSGSRL